MQINDLINGIFEFGGGFLVWFNVQKILKDKTVSGVYWPVQAFWATWGLWNLLYYSSLGHWASFTGGVLLVIGNTIWVLLAIKYMLQNRNAIK